MSTPKEKRIRNPSQDEMDKLAAGSEAQIMTVEGTPVTSVPKDEVDEDYTKPIDDYEPDPVLFRLPSGTTTVSKKYLTNKNEILVRRLTTIEESMFKNFGNQDFLTAIEGQMDSCIKTKISVQDLSFIDKLPLYMFLLALTYGKDFVVDQDCDYCRKTFPVKIDLQKDILDRIKYVPDDLEYPKKIKIDSYDSDIFMHCTYQTIGENNLISDKGTILDQMLTLVKKVSGTDKSGKTISAEDRENIVKFLNDKDRKKFRDFIVSFSEYGTDLMLKKKVCTNGSCEACDKKVDMFLPVVSMMMDLIRKIV